MNWAGKPHPIETLAEWLAPLALAAAAGWSSWMLAMPAPAIGVMAVSAFAVGMVIIRAAGKAKPPAIEPFEPAVFEAGVLDELLLEAKDELLELDDPLVEPEPDSRVVQLFARPEPTPGELVERIADFLGDGRRPAAAPALPGNNSAPDASAALHAALANIRASLR
jgi:hypothetical protein